jgi:ATP-dependent RNA helicase RhlE
LSKVGIFADSIHGNKSLNQRQRALTMFKSDRIQALIATDVAARGIDIDDVSHVINYDEPDSYDTYIHRIGRTGRANKQGFALTFVGA